MKWQNDQWSWWWVWKMDLSIYYNTSINKFYVITGHMYSSLPQSQISSDRHSFYSSLLNSNKNVMLKIMSESMTERLRCLHHELLNEIILLTSIWHVRKLSVLLLFFRNGVFCISAHNFQTCLENVQLADYKWN